MQGHQGRDRNKVMVVVVVVVGGGRRALLLLPPIPILILHWRSARAEWLEGREGRLQRSGASPLRGARKEDAAGGQDVLACAWNRHGQSQWISKRTRQRQREMQRMGRLVTLFACAWARHGQRLCK